ncbi:zinc finger MYM-type protein 1-like [Solenopsis invicta]|uniref:zinc finger MYM-type protein 1-like n=1 Tax=Solenopsis invicta TaxID=13686 RepID=UPI00193DB282|nr:zinc finger MYM-type protein 1-like [Solenopsis invicta]
MTLTTYVKVKIEMRDMSLKFPNEISYCDVSDARPRDAVGTPQPSPPLVPPTWELFKISSMKTRHLQNYFLQSSTMNDGRKRLSGYQFRKNAKEKREKEEKVLKQTATLELFFSKSNSTSVACASTRNDNSETEAVKRDSILNQSTTAVCKEENDIIIKDVEKETTTINEIVSSGHTNYLSATIYEELIQLMAKKTQETILAEIKKAKYYSVIIDSTPDISHIDQLSFIIRYVQEYGSPVERFITFLPNTGHKSQELAETVSKTLIDLDIDISSCRGQSYDNAANMSGAYSGLQMRIKELNPLAEYVPCAAHSLNLVGTCAASCCTEATNFFGVLQELFNFFSASTHRWEILQSYMKAKLTLKRLSTTRWSARDDACRSLNESWLEIIEALSFIENNAAEKNITRSEAKGLRIRLERLETAFMAIFWDTLLSRLNASSKKLQSIDIDISIVLELYKSLINFVQRIRNDFDEFENKAKLLSNEQKYERCKSRIKKRKLQLDESRDGDADETFSSRDRFRIETFLVILDSLRTELEKRCSGYELIHDRFIVLIKLRELSSVEIREHAIRVCEGFPDDIELSIVEELLHLREQLLLPENISQEYLELKHPQTVRLNVHFRACDE